MPVPASRCWAFRRSGTPNFRCLPQLQPEVLPQLTPQYEVILVNDGSLDQSWTAILDLRERYAWLRAINLMRNYGHFLVFPIEAVSKADDIPPRRASLPLTN